MKYQNGGVVEPDKHKFDLSAVGIEADGCPARRIAVSILAADCRAGTPGFISDANLIVGNAMLVRMGMDQDSHTKSIT